MIPHPLVRLLVFSLVLHFPLFHAIVDTISVFIDETPEFHSFFVFNLGLFHVHLLLVNLLSRLLSGTLTFLGQSGRRKKNNSQC